MSRADSISQIAVSRFSRVDSANVNRHSGAFLALWESADNDNAGRGTASSGWGTDSPAGLASVWGESSVIDANVNNNAKKGGAAAGNKKAGRKGK